MELERLIWITPLNSRMVTTHPVVLLNLFLWLLSTIVWLSRDYEPI